MNWIKDVNMTVISLEAALDFDIIHNTVYDMYVIKT